MERTGYYFGAGPAVLPDEILEKAASALLNFKETGLSILEIGHRTELFTSLLDAARKDLRALLNIPENYQILFLGGAARQQFSTVPLNLISRKKEKAAYICSGLWSELAFEEAKRFSDAYVAKNSAYQSDTAYLYYTPNETVDGVRIARPEVEDIPLVSDMTSCFLSEPIAVEKFGLIFAGAQKNIGPAGLTLVLIRDDLLDIIPKHTVPVMSDYRVHAKYQSVYATPPVFQCYMAAEMFRFIKAKGGVEAMHEINQAKAKKLYDYIDASIHYDSLVPPDNREARSIMNVCFSMRDKSKEARFLEIAEQKGLKGLKGHRLRGGLRASLYNAMPMAGVDALIECMDTFVQ